MWENVYLIKIGTEDGTLIKCGEFTMVAIDAHEGHVYSSHLEDNSLALEYLPNAELRV